MRENLDVAALKSAICGLTEVESTNQGFEVTLPQIYHSGHNVAVVVSREASGFIIHDNSYAAMLLANLGITAGKRLSDAMRPQVAAYGCECVSHVQHITDGTCHLAAFQLQ